MIRKYTVYTISLGSKVMYVGESANFPQRRYLHRNKRGTSQSAIPLDVDLSLVVFEKIAVYDTRNEALETEDSLIKEYDTINNGWNKRRSGRTPIDVKMKKGLKGKDYCRAYRQTMKDEILKLRKENAMLKEELKRLKNNI